MPVTRRHRRRGFRMGALAVTGAVVLAGCTNSSPPGPATTSAPAAASAPTLPPPSPLPTTDVSQDPVVQVVKRVGPAVVNVTTSIVQANPLGGAAQGKGVGTGFVIRSDGIIVTNFHVVEGAVAIKVNVPPPHQKSYSARVIGGDSDHDLAVLKIDATNLPTLSLGDSKQVQLGERVIAIGYALALEGGPTVTSGIISSLARTVRVQDPNGPTRTYQDALQTDGHQSGQLGWSPGRPRGQRDRHQHGRGDVGREHRLLHRHRRRETHHRPGHRPPQFTGRLHGVSTETVDPAFAAQLNLPVSRGALVLAVTGPAQKAGIRVGDVIVSLDGRAVSSSDDLGKIVFAKKPGDAVQVGLVSQQGRRRTVTLTLGVRPLPT